MFQGTTIEELLEIVERAEEHAHTVEMKSEATQPMMYPGFMAELTNTTHDWVGAF
jgi:hypothetical protein